MPQFLTSSSVYCCFDNGDSRKKNAERKEVMRLVSVPCLLPPPIPPPGLTIASLFSLLPANPYSLQCKQSLFYLHTCPAPGAAGRRRARPPNLCAYKGYFLC